MPTADDQLLYGARGGHPPFLVPMIEMICVLIVLISHDGAYR